MLGSLTTPGRAATRADAADRVAFRLGNAVGTRDKSAFAAQWPACTLACRRFPSLSREPTDGSGPCGSLRLHCGGLPPLAPCRSPGALPTRLKSDTRPLPAADGAYAFGIVDQEVPSLSAGLDDVVVGVPDPGAELILPQVVPDVFDCISMLPLYAGFLVRSGLGIAARSWRVRPLSSSPARCAGRRGRPTAHAGGPGAASGRRCGGGCRGVRLPHGASTRRPAGAARPRSKSAACRSCRGGTSGAGSSRPRKLPVWADASQQR